MPAGPGDKGQRIRTEDIGTTGRAGFARRLLRRTGLYSWRLGAALCLLLALYVSAGRLLAPQLEARHAMLEAELAERLGVELRIGALGGAWHGFSPLVELRDLKFRFPASPASPSHDIGYLSLQLDLPASLWRRNWTVDRMRVEGPVLELTESAAGRWTLAGFSAGGGNFLSRALDLLLSTREVEVLDAELLLRPAAGEAVRLMGASLALRNGEGRHRLRLRAPLQDGEPLELSMEIEGDPRGEYSGRGYLRFDSPDLTGLAAALAPARLEIEGLAGGARVWAEFGRAGLSRLHGELRGLSLAGSDAGTGRTLALQEANGSFSLLRPAPESWRLWLQSFGFGWRGGRLPATDLFMDLRGGEEAELELLAPRLDLAAAADLLLRAGLVPEGGRAALADLDPAGELRALRLRLPLARPLDFALEANLAGVEVGAWNGAPAVRGVDGYVRAGGRGGFVELDAGDFWLHLPKVFEQGWQYHRVNSRVHWRVERDRIRINSGVIDARAEDVHGRVQFELLNTRRAEGGWDSRLSLLVGLLEVDAAAKSPYLPVLENIAPTMDWLDAALLSGRVERSGLVFRGATHRDPPPGSSTFQGFFDFNGAALRYLPGWPAIEDAAGSVRIADREADIRVHGARSAGIALAPARATLRPATEGAGSWLSVNGGAVTEAGLGLEFLRRSPLRAQIGDFLDGWRAEGAIDVALDLRLPLSVPGARPEIGVEMLSEDGLLEMPAYGLSFEDVAGLVSYSSERGLSAQRLDARLFGFPVSADIESFERRSPAAGGREFGTRIHGSGRASGSALAAWSGQSRLVDRLLSFSEGEFDYRADLSIFPSPGAGGVRTRLALESSLQGLASALPAPFGKSAEESRLLQLQLEFREQDQILTTHYGGNFYGRMFLAGDGIQRGLLYFGPLNRDFSVRQSDSSEPGLLVTGSLDSLDLDAWREVADKLRSGPGEQEVRSNLRLVDMNFGRLALFGQALEEVNAQLRYAEDGWNVFLENPRLRGSLQLPGAPGQPYVVDLDYLRLPVPAEAAPGSARPDPLAGVDPASLPPLQFSAREILVGDKPLGNWRFLLGPLPDGVRISNLKVAMDDASITDAAGEGGATLQWRLAGGVHSSAFDGRFHAGDLAAVLPSLGYNANVESEMADFAGALSWPGSPAAFSLAASSGRVNLRIEDGRFVDIDSGGSRLFGALSVDAIVRRLQLDFSDLYQRGFAYDSIEGGLDFESGMVTTGRELRIEGPSSKIAIDGVIDLARQTIDADMLVSVPLSQNISVLAGLMGAWPIAVSTYVAGKIFEEQMEDFTSVLYRLEGPWDNLRANFEVPVEETPKAQ